LIGSRGPDELHCDTVNSADRRRDRLFQPNRVVVVSARQEFGGSKGGRDGTHCVRDDGGKGGWKEAKRLRQAGSRKLGGKRGGESKGRGGKRRWNDAERAKVSASIRQVEVGGMSRVGK
jgi:hypothetical protein